MDLGTVIGVISGIALLVISIMVNASITVFLDLPSFLIVFGGATAATLIAFSLKDVLNTFQVLKKIFTHQAIDLNKIIKDFVEYAAIIRKDGPQKLEKLPVEDRFVKKALQLISDGATEEHINMILSIDKDAMMERHRTGQDILETMGDLFPAFGMVGTMIGLVIMLLNLSDPSSIGPSMAIALITTFYGAVFANLIAIPAAKKLEQRSKNELTEKELIIQATISLSKAENPRMMEEKLRGFLHPGAIKRKGLSEEAPPAKAAVKTVAKKPGTPTRPTVVKK